MDIRCQSSKRYLFKVNMEEYHNKLKKMGIDVNIPLVIEYPCSKCKMIEVYEIYPNSYRHIKSYKRDVDNKN